MKRKSKIIVALTVIIMVYVSIGLLCACDFNCGSNQSSTPPDTPLDPPYNLSFTFLKETNSYAVSKGKTTDTEIEIPKTYEGKKVTRIKASGFENYSLLEKVTIPNTIQVIGSSAFHNCTNLKTVVINSCSPKSSSLVIGDCAFAGCNNLVHLELPNQLKTVRKYAFQNCSSLKQVTIPDTVNEIEESTFSGCSNLKSIKLPFIGKKIDTTPSPSTLFGYIFGKEKFEGSKATTQYYAKNESTVYYMPMLLTDITIANANLIYGAFYNCSQIKSLTLKNVSNIDQKCFFGADYIETANIPAEVIAYLPKDKLTHITISGSQDISAKALSECETLTEVNINGSFSKIGENAFDLCRNLKKVTISDYIKEIGNSAFYNCSELTIVTIGNSVTSIGSGAFNKCSKLKTVYLGENLVGIGDEAFAFTDIENLDIPAKVEKIGNSAFANCSNLTSVNIGSGVQSIGYQSFYSCNSLSNVVFSETSHWNVYQSVGNEIAVNGLENATTAANLLCNRYTNFYWERG